MEAGEEDAWKGEERKADRRKEGWDDAVRYGDVVAALNMDWAVPQVRP